MRKLLTCALICALSIFVGCSSSGELTREQALQSLTIGTYHPHTQADLLVTIGTTNSKCRPYLSAEDKFLQAAGFLVINENRGLRTVSLTDRGKAAIEGTTYGHHIDGSCETWQVTVPAFKAAKVEVSGIKLINPTAAEVHYRWTWEPTEVGRALTKSQFEKLQLPRLVPLELASHIANGGAPISLLPMDDGDLGRMGGMSARFAKYDDGWRMESN